ncbi:uncharacterized protein UMAG_10485 [Mycosarcoma maydis]|uniref:CCHC-type domain-containing protein n=1 Tax=Mycosarcoma maydis TaxID=5270 RepID=A0A0D1DV29_MYCMD|nr:uncharacterized protein UMAG_10485 [Ustilago maydis 521]KIS68104.1 hypothetical protein UMAG_10485 [Ustilago maydis 521]|eukprot:XP_011390309.1 hypothetical protein UMAG_10485 [Ustilago maydis 521]
MDSFRYKTLMRALLSDRNALFTAIFIVYQGRNGIDTYLHHTVASVAEVLRECSTLAAENAPVKTLTTLDDSKLVTLRYLMNCWACDQLGRAANSCPDDEAHARWKQNKAKLPPKIRANIYVVLPRAKVRSV